MVVAGLQRLAGFHLLSVRIVLLQLLQDISPQGIPFVLLGGFWLFGTSIALAVGREEGEALDIVPMQEIMLDVGCRAAFEDATLEEAGVPESFLAQAGPGTLAHASASESSRFPGGC